MQLYQASQVNGIEGEANGAGCIEVDSNEISKFLLLLLGLVHKSPDTDLSWDDWEIENACLISMWKSNMEMSIVIRYT